MKNAIVNKGACSLVHIIFNKGLQLLVHMQPAVHIIIILSLALFLFAVPVLCPAQTQFARAVGGTDNDYAKSVVQTNDGGYVIAGYTYSFGAGGDDLFLVKFDSTGVVEWAKTVGGTGNDKGYSVIQTFDGGYAVVGETWTFSAGSCDLFLVKFSSTGAVEWSRTVGGTNIDYGGSVIQTTDGGYAVAGATYSFGAGTPTYKNLFFVKVDSMGSIEWSRAIGGTDDDYGKSVLQTSDGGYAVVGLTESFGAGLDDLFLVKLSATGTVEWTKAIGGTNYDYGNSIVQTSDGGYAVAGWTQSFGTSGSDLFLAKFSLTGEFEWFHAVDGTSDDIGRSIVQTANGGYAVAGFTYSFGAGFYDLFLVKFDSTGAIEWSRVVGGGAYDYGNSVVQTTDGGYAVAGETESFGAGNRDLFLVKFGRDGNSCIGEYVSPTVTDVIPTITDTLPTVTEVSPIVTDTLPTVTNVTPEVDTICTGLGIMETIVKPQTPEINVSPNPFNLSCAITLSGVNKGACSLVDGTVEIYDLRGNVVWKANLSDSKERLQRDAKRRWSSGTLVWTPDKSIPSGIYLIKATIGEQTITKRAILMK